MTLKEVLEWMRDAERDDLTAIADDLIERGFAVHPDDVPNESFFMDDATLDIDEGAIEEARDRLRRREYPETLHCLAIALGRDFDDLERIASA